MLKNRLSKIEKAIRPLNSGDFKELPIEERNAIIDEMTCKLSGIDPEEYHKLSAFERRQIRLELYEILKANNEI
jgi:hypothetical protein